MSGNNSIALSQLPLKLVADSSDAAIVWSNTSGNNFQTPVGNLFANSTMTSKALVITGNATPANSTANVVGGSLWSDGTYIYFAPANNVIKRVTLASF